MLLLSRIEKGEGFRFPQVRAEVFLFLAAPARFGKRSPNHSHIRSQAVHRMYVLYRITMNTDNILQWCSALSLLGAKSSGMYTWASEIGSHISYTSRHLRFSLPAMASTSQLKSARKCAPRAMYQSYPSFLSQVPNCFNHIYIFDDAWFVLPLSIWPGLASTRCE